jgi:hypothetical protein
MRKCDCSHLGRCPVTTRVHPMAHTYADGTPVYRGLGQEEQRATLRCPEACDKHEHQGSREPRLQSGDWVAATKDGHTIVAYRALDGFRAVQDAKRVVGCRCRAGGWLWRKRHPVPGVDLERARQYAADKKAQQKGEDEEMGKPQG